MDPEAPKEDNLDTFLNSEEPDEIVIDGNADYCDDLARFEEAIHQIWREQGLTDDEIASWNEGERQEHEREAIALLKTQSDGQANQNSITWDEIEKNWMA